MQIEPAYKDKAKESIPHIHEDEYTAKGQSELLEGNYT